MNRFISVLLFCVPVLAASDAFSLELKAPFPLEVGGRFEYKFQVLRDGNIFPWNYSSTAVSDRTRLMLDLHAGGEKTGVVYLKGVALRENGRDLSERKRFEFEQGNYLWKAGANRARIRFRLFANERRFFTFSFIAPLLEDDRLKDAGGNRGMRFDGEMFGKYSLTGLYASLGENFDNAKRIAYLKAAYMFKYFGISTVYHHQNRPQSGLPDIAVFKTEMISFYKKACLILSYEQSGRGRGLFFPSGTFHPDDFVGDNFSRVLPDAGAFFAEARLRALPFRKWGFIHFTHRYFTVGKQFAGDLTGAEKGAIGYTSGAYFTADKISLNGRVVYSKRIRWRVESEKREFMEASAWTALKNGSEVFVRGLVGKTADGKPFVTKENFLHAALRHRHRKMQTGVHFMLEDLNTVFSERKFAWDSRLLFGGSFAIYWRTILSKNLTTSDAVYARFEYRPSKRLFLTASYGRSFFGDDPFLLEDPDIGLMGGISPVYGLSIRGDF